ncbi:MAG TPA: elongation factor G [Pseudomonadota bacterium]|nr:elongation factor G [Pseudomonadota bacterium]
MRNYSEAEIRDVVVIGHGGSGKTSLGEAILFDAKLVTRLGRVDDETSNLDSEPEEKKRKGTINPHVTAVEWQKGKLNLIDTSGQGDFVVDTMIAIGAADSALCVVSASDGVQVYTEKTWEEADALHMPRMIFVNKMERERADFAVVLDQIHRVLSPQAVAVQLPIGSESSFEGMIDLVAQKAYRFSEDGRDVTVSDVPASLAAATKEARDKLIEEVAGSDDDLMAAYFDHGTLTDEELQLGLQRAVAAGKLFPVFCGSAAQNRGVQPLLDAMVAWFPPASAGRTRTGSGKSGSEVRRSPKSSEPLSAYVFKIIPTEVGKMALVRIVSGKIAADSPIWNASHDKGERVGQLYVFTPGKRTSVPEAHAGDIVGLAKLKLTRIGDTFSDEKEVVKFAAPTVPAPVVRYSLHLKGKTDEAKLAQKLHDIHEEDLSLSVEYDPATKETLIGGCGPVHIEATLDKLRRVGVEVELAPPRVPYLETIRGRVKNIEGKHKKQTGGKGQFGVCYLDLDPAPRGTGLVFEDAIVGGAIPRQFIPSVEKGIKERMVRGGLAGYPITDVKVRLFDGKYHDVDSDSRSFEMAGSKGFLAAFKQASPVLLEPYMKIEVSIPEEYMGAIIGDLNNRRAHIAGMEAKGKYQIVIAQIPMSETLDYSAFLRSATGGRGSFSLATSHYAEMPQQLADKVIASAKKHVEEEEE